VTSAVEGQAAAAMPETLIAPPSRWSWPLGGELWQYRDLIYFLTKRELQIRYKQSFFGIGWAVLQPLGLAFIFALIFGHFLKVDSEGLPYAVFGVVGLVPWLFTAQAIQLGATSLVLDANLISKVYFPRISLPIAKALSLVIDLIISFGVVLVMMAIYGVGVGAMFYLVPLFVLLGVVTTFALTSLLAAVNVKYRDVQLVLPMLIQVLFFATPIIYPASYVHGDWIYLYAINPMVTVIEGTRWALLGTPAPETGVVAVSVASAVLLLGLALRYFQRTERYFADLV
jgi:lipopolysaccharide transport system permease protein